MGNVDIKDHSDHEVDQIVDEVSLASVSLNQLSQQERTQKLMVLGELLMSRKKELAEVMHLEMGKQIAEGIAEIEKCKWVCNYYAENGREFLEPKQISTNYHKSYVTYQPLGTILAIMPWNFPFWQVFRFLAPSLMLGNTAVLKHASNVRKSAYEIEKLVIQAGFPKNVFRNVFVGSKKVKRIIENDKINAITLTGSTPAGKSVAELAGRHLKKLVLELGGSDPYLILEDALISEAVKRCVKGRMLNCGQSCIGAKRFIVVDKVYDHFLDEFIVEMKKYSMDFETNSGMRIGPMAKKEIRNELHEMVLLSMEKGATLELGGYLPDKNEPYYPATILTNVKKGMPAYSEEFFGPVASIIRVHNEEEAIKVANDTSFGLGAAIFSQNIEKAEDLAKNKLNAGACFVNDFVKSDPRLPFGGVKESGFGRELSLWGIHEFANIKTICVDNLSDE